MSQSANEASMMKMASSDSMVGGLGYNPCPPQSQPIVGYINGFALALILFSLYQFFLAKKVGDLKSRKNLFIIAIISLAVALLLFISTKLLLPPTEAIGFDPRTT